MSGAGSGSAEDRGSDNEYKRTFLQGIEQEGIEYNKEIISMYKQYKSSRDKEMNSGSYWSDKTPYPFFNLIEPKISMVQPLIANAKAFSDNAIVVISRLGGEGRDLPQEQYKWNGGGKSDVTTVSDRTYLELTSEEEDLLELVGSEFSNVIVLLNTCNAMELGFLEDAKYGVDAALNVSCPGQSGSISIAKILKGEVNPSGKTTDIYAYDLTTAATYANAPNGQNTTAGKNGEKQYQGGGNYIDYSEGIYVGYKWYETADTEGYWDARGGYENVVQYPFGYGKSYTQFAWNVMSVTPASGSRVTEDTEVTIVVSVTNEGTVPGRDVLQLYYTPYYKQGETQIEKSSVNLGEFEKTEVLYPKDQADTTHPYEQLVTIKFRVSDMKSYDYAGVKTENGGYVLEKGEYSLTLRTDSHTVADAEGKGATITYSIEDDIILDTDETTGNSVENRFTGDQATDNGISIDGSNTGANIKYMSRANFEETFPVMSTEKRSKDSKLVAQKDNWLSDRKNTDVMPTQGVDSGVRLYTGDNYSEMNEDVIFTYGNPENFDDEALWDELLNQLPVSELVGLVEGGGYQTAAAPSIGKPAVTDLDGPSGLNDTNMTVADKKEAAWTSFPVETVMGQTWSKRLAYVYGLAVGNEACNGKFPVSGWYAPAVNIHRSPFDGRNFEYFSEDPYLSGILGANTVEGATSNGLYCYIKHFAVNETEFNRSGLYTWLTEQALREIYLKPFEICVKEGEANAIMSSFNRIGATWAGGSYALLTEVLRNEWGFKGSVVTDYSSGGTYMSVDQGVRAGGDLWLNGARSVLLNNGISDKSSATAISCMRDAAKNIVYTHCNTLYRLDQFIKNPDANNKFTVQLGSRAASGAVPYWLIGLIAADVVIVAALVFWGIRIFKPKTENK